MKTLILVLALSAFHSANAVEHSLVEIPVIQTYVPPQGYDDNDNVGLVIQGDLPDPCYQLGATKVERLPGNVIRVHQMAWRRTEGLCGSGDLIDEDVPFTTEVPLGQLPQGDYHVQRLAEGERVLSRDFHVDHAPVNTIDSLNYAVVTHVMMDDYTHEGKKVVAQISGIVSSRCMQIEKPIRIIPEGDVIVVLPVAKVGRTDCGTERVEFKETIELNDLKMGDYLLHVRSKNGKAVNSVFTVLKPVLP